MPFPTPERARAAGAVAIVVAFCVLALFMQAVTRKAEMGLLRGEASLTASALGASLGRVEDALASSATLFASGVIMAPPGVTASALVFLSATPGGTWTASAVRPAGAPSALAKALAGVGTYQAGQLQTLGFEGGGPSRVIAFAERAQANPHYAVYIESPSPAAPALGARGPTQRNAVANSLNFALYLQGAEDARHLVVATTKLPLRGTRMVVDVSPGLTQAVTPHLSRRPGSVAGGPNDFLIVVTPRMPLLGRLGLVPWGIAAAGLLLAFGYYVGSGILGRARSVATHRGELLESAAEERRELETHLRQAQKLEALGQLAGGVAHDFNNLLTAIISNSELAQARLAEHPARDEVQEILDAAMRAAGLTRQLLVFSRREPVELTDVDLNSAVSGIHHLLERTIGEQVQFSLNLGQDLPLVTADVSGVEQLVMNMAVNARDAMPNGGHLSISTSESTLERSYADLHGGLQPGRYVLLQVSDTGTGMAPEVAERIFEPFFTTKGVGKGTGLGLSTCFGIVSRWNGHITVYSEPGHGSTFKVWIPIARGSVGRAQAPVVPPAPPVGGKGANVLLVEDDPRVRLAIHKILETARHHVVEASSGPEALETLKRLPDPPDLLLTDMVMPGGMTGRDLANRVRECSPTTAIIKMSGYSADVVPAVTPGVVLLQKPFTTTELLTAVERVLGAKESK